MADEEEDDDVQGELQQATSRASAAGSRAAELNESAGRQRMSTQPQSPLGGLLNGILQGYQVRQQMQDAAVANQRQKTQDVLNDRNASVQDIMNRQMLQQNARPVTNGTVTESRPDTSYTGASAVPGAAPITAGVPGGNFVRKADASRTVTYSDKDGNKQQYELKTPDEQQGDQAAAAQAKFRATAIPLQLTEDQVPPGMSRTVYIQPQHLAQYLQATNQYKPVATTDAQQAAGAPATVPQRNVGQVITNTGAAQRNDANNDTKTAIAAGNNDTRSSIADAGNAARTAIADSNNTTKKAIAASGNATKTAIAAGVQSGADGRAGNRLTAAQTAAANKQMQALQAKEDEIQATRVQLKSDLQNPDLPSMQKQVKQGQLATTAYQVQQYQTRKAALVGAQTPPKDVMAKIPEGQQATAPDGHVWKKQDGIVLFVH
jgi:hypothetical protein